MRTLATLLSLSILSIASVASAEEASFHLQGGPTEVLAAPWSDPGAIFTNSPFHTGATGEAKLLFKLIPNLAFGPDVAINYLPQSGPHAGVPSGGAVLWTYGGALRLQGNRHAAWSPYVEVAGGAAAQSNIWNPYFASTIGADFAVEGHHHLWIGPYISWNHTAQVHTTVNDQTLLLSNADVDMITVGASLSFDFHKSDFSR